MSSNWPGNSSTNMGASLNYPVVPSPNCPVSRESVSPRHCTSLPHSVLESRLAAEQVISEPLNHPEAIYALLGTEMRLLDRESLRVVLLDTRYRLIAISEISKGTLNESLAHPREIFKPAISHSACAFVLVHNHPSGDRRQVRLILRLTRRVAECARMLQIQFLDHSSSVRRRKVGRAISASKKPGFLAASHHRPNNAG